MKTHLRDKQAKEDDWAWPHIKGAIRDGQWTVCHQNAPDSHITDDPFEVTCKRCEKFEQDAREVGMRFKCIDDTGYENRLTLEKVYDLNWLFPSLGPNDLVEMVFDDGTQGEVFGERFEKYSAVIDREFKPLKKGLKKQQVDLTKANIGKNSLMSSLDDYERLKNELEEVKELERLVVAGQMAIADAKRVIKGEISIDEALQNNPQESVFQSQYLGSFPTVEEPPPERNMYGGVERVTISTCRHCGMSHRRKGEYCDDACMRMAGRRNKRSGVERLPAGDNVEPYNARLHTGEAW